MTRILSHNESQDPGSMVIRDETSAETPANERDRLPQRSEPQRSEAPRSEAPREQSRGRDASHDPASQYYIGLSRQLTTLTKAGGADGTVTIGLTSAVRYEGVTSVAVNLAAAACRDMGGRVLLVDANLQHPQAAELAGGRSGEGLADLLAHDDVTLGECVQHSAVDNLDVLSAGSSKAREQAAGTSGRIRDLLREMSREYQMVVFDLPTANELTICLPIASCLDGVVLVIEAEKTRNKTIDRAKHQLKQSGAEVIGAVLNKRREYVPNWIYNRI